MTLVIMVIMVVKMIMNMIIMMISCIIMMMILVPDDIYDNNYTKEVLLRIMKTKEITPLLKNINKYH